MVLFLYSHALRQTMLFSQSALNRRFFSSVSNAVHQAKFISSQQSQIESKRKFHSSPIRDDIFKVQDEDDFKCKVMQSKKPVIVEFHAEWCGPCKQLMPRLESIVHGLKGEPVDLAKVDIDDLPDIAMEFGVGAVPSVLGIRQGKVIDKFVGLQDEDKIKTFISNISKK